MLAPHAELQTSARNALGWPPCPPTEGERADERLPDRRLGTPQSPSHTPRWDRTPLGASPSMRQSPPATPAIPTAGPMLRLMRCHDESASAEHSEAITSMAASRQGACGNEPMQVRKLHSHAHMPMHTPTHTHALCSLRRACNCNALGPRLQTPRIGPEVSRPPCAGAPTRRLLRQKSLVAACSAPPSDSPSGSFLAPLAVVLCSPSRGRLHARNNPRR